MVSFLMSGELYKDIKRGEYGQIYNDIKYEQGVKLQIYIQYTHRKVQIIEDEAEQV